MIPGPAIVALDDNQEHLGQLVDCLNRMELAALPILFEGGKPQLSSPLSSIQLFFLDINLVPGVPPTESSQTAAFDIVANALECIIGSDNQPYVLITWSTYPTEHDKLMNYLGGNLGDHFPVPAASASMDKNKFLAATVGYDFKGLEADIRAVLDGMPQVGAMMQWSESARIAAGETVNSLLRLVPREDRFNGNGGEKLERMLTAVAREGGGKHAVDNLTSSMNEGLGPILMDRLMNATEANRKISEKSWAAAISNPAAEPMLDVAEKAALNSMSAVSTHDIEHVSAGSRGAVSELPADLMEPKAFANAFGTPIAEIINEYLELLPSEKRPEETRTRPAKKALREELSALCHFRLVGLSAACDHAWGKVPVKNLLLALEVPVSVFVNFQVAGHGASHDTPHFILSQEDGEKCLIFNWRYKCTRVKELGVGSLYRLREPLVTQVITSYHIYGFRPGIPNY